MSDGNKTTSPTSGDGGKPAGSATVPCTSCSVSISPKPLKVCGSSPAALTATGSPAGGSFAWSSDNTAVATVSGSGSSATVTGKATGSANIKVTYSPAGCGPCSDTVAAKVCVCTPVAGGGRLYAYAQKSIANLTGGKAKIKTRWGKLCCEDIPCNDVAKKNAYVNISRGGNWAQTGYRRYRNAGSTTPSNMRYTEMNGATYKRKDKPEDAPAEGTVHEYRIELDPSTGTWDYYYDGDPFPSSFQDDAWKDSSGSVINWPGEILNKEDDMPGTSGDKCSFTECQYRVDGSTSFVDAGIRDSNLHNDDSSEFGIDRTSGTAFNIWDKKPNP